MRMPLRLAICGLPKTGKSFLGASFVKEFDGIVFDFAGVSQTRPDQKSKVEYWVSDSEYGDAYWSCNTVGINLDKQYRLIKSWDEFVKTVDYAKAYSKDVKKSNKRIWIVLDDTMMWRWHAAIHASKVSDHKSIVKDDWGQATTNMTTIMRVLESQFNLLFLNQKRARYVGEEDTGEIIPAWFPPSLPYAADILGELWKEEDKCPNVQHLNVIANRFNWSCGSDYINDILNPSPQLILKLQKVNEELW